MRQLTGLLLIALMTGCTRDYYGTAKKPSADEQAAMDTKNCQDISVAVGKIAMQMLGSMAENASK